MMRILAALLAAGMLVVGSAFATIYKYVDDSGQVIYTNVLSSVPEDKLSDVTKTEEYKSKAVPASPSPSVRVTSPSSNPSDFTQKSVVREKPGQMEKLETEYKRLLKEKKNLDNDKSFQKRRLKKRYQNRPYIQSLIKKEEQLTIRLEELEQKLNSLKK